MKNTRHAIRFAACFALTLVAVPFIGCGGSANSPASTSSPAPTGSFVTRAGEAGYSVDALVVASREAPDVFIPTATATTISSDLDAIRARYPQLASIHARPLDDLKSVLVSVRNGSTVASAWSQGTLATGVSALDAALTTYKATGVKTVYSSGEKTFYAVTFTDPLNTARVRENLASAAGSDAGILDVLPNVAVGDGDQIARATSGSDKVYAFQHGFGDCLAGCINKHTWTVTLASDGSMTLTESGAVLPTLSGVTAL